MTSSQHHFDPTDPRSFQIARAVITQLVRAGLCEQMIADALGPSGMASAHSRNPGGALWQLARHAEGKETVAAVMTSGVYLHQPLTRDQWEVVLDNVEDCVDVGLLTPPDHQSDSLVITIDIRPVRAAHHGEVEIMIISDQDRSFALHNQRADHVPGVGNAPRSLLQVIPPLTMLDQPHPRVLDLGTGSGVIAAILAAHYPNAQITGTDISPRALAFARLATVCGSAQPDDGSTLSENIEWAEGSWFCPVDERQFDMIVANPPFVIGPASRLTYRETELDLDGVSQLVVSHAAKHLTVGGTAHILAAWAVQQPQDAAGRVAEWIPSSGYTAWAVQRDLVDIQTYVSTWLQDEGVDLRTRDGMRRCTEWLDYFSHHGVQHVGMGYVHIKRMEDSAQPSSMTFETLDHALPDGALLGQDVAEWFMRAEWLDAASSDDVLDSRFAVRPSAAIQKVEVANAAEGFGFQPFSTTLSRTDGPAWSHQVDEHLEAVVRGLNPCGLSLRDTAELYAAVHGLDEQGFADAIVPLVVDLVRHGIVIPTDIVGTA